MDIRHTTSAEFAQEMGIRQREAIVVLKCLVKLGYAEELKKKRDTGYRPATVYVIGTK